MKNRIVLTTNPTEHAGWIIVDAGRMTQEQISVVTIARPMGCGPITKKEEHYSCLAKLPLNQYFPSKISLVKKNTLPKRAPSRGDDDDRQHYQSTCHGDLHNVLTDCF